MTGDRILGLAALAVGTGIVAAGRLQWTPIHSALAVFLGAQVLTTLLNAWSWPEGLKFATVYVLGFACFCVAAEWARPSEGRQRFVKWWVAIGAGLGVSGTLLAFWANFTQHIVWGTGAVQTLLLDPSHPKLVVAGKVTFGEWNLFSSFLLIPFALALWRWRPGADPRWSPWRAACVAATVFGLAFGFTRATWLAMVGIIVLWWWVKRPRWWQLAALASMLGVAFLLQAAALGAFFPRGDVAPRSSPEPRRVTALSGDTAPRTDAAPYIQPAPLARASPLWFRVVEPVKTGFDENMVGRLTISRATVESWLARPVVGHGAGSTNRLVVTPPSAQPGGKVWNGNLVLFVLHDSGLIGFAALVALVIAVWRRGLSVVRGGADEMTSSLAVPLLAVGGALCLAYQFTHGLWLMYPYVFLGLLTAATDSGSRAP